MTTPADGAAPTFPAYLVRGDDPVLVSDAVRALVAELVGGDDPSLSVEELSGENYELAAVVDAAQTLPFLGERRVVVARDVGRFLTADVAPVVAYLADPAPTSTLVLVADGGQIPKALVEAVRKVGHVVDAGVPGGRGRSAWLAARLKEGPVKLDARAATKVGEHLGDDLGRLGSVLEMLAAAYGEGARVGPEEVEAFLGQAGSVAPWELTDAIDQGETETALAVLHRLMGAGGRHPLVLIATLHTHFGRMLRLEGSGATGEVEAAALLGMTKSTFPAKKALLQSRRLGYRQISRAVTLLAEADLDLKGRTDWPPELVMEVLVARLARLAPRPAGSTRRR